MKFKIETTSEVYNPRDWKFRAETTMKFKVETTERKLKKEFLIISQFFFKKIRLKVEERQEKVKIVKDGIEEDCESEGREV